MDLAHRYFCLMFFACLKLYEDLSKICQRHEDCQRLYKKELKVELNDDDYYCIHRIGLKREKNGNKYHQIIVKFRNFSSRTQVYRARKR